MKKVTSALALAALMGTPAAAVATAEFGGDFDARYYNVQDQADSNATGFDQRIRLQSVFETDGGVEVHARLNLINDRWSGDASGGANVNVDEGDIDGVGDERPFSNHDHRNVELDYGYVRMPFLTGRLSVGRQMVNWNPMGLTSADARRDRISFLQPFGGSHVGELSYDRLRSPSRTIRESNGNLILASFLGPLAQSVNYGLQFGHFTGEGSGATATDGNLATRGATLVAPYIEGEAGDFRYGAGFHYLGGGHGTEFTEGTFAGYVTGGFQFTPEFKLEGQVLHAADGALVAGGYDTYSSLIHNSPEHSQSATRIEALDLDGEGTEAEDGTSRTLVAARGTYHILDWSFVGALGYADYDGAGDNEVIFADAQMHFQLTPSTKMFATAGYADLAEDVDDRDNFWATSLNLNVQF